MRRFLVATGCGVVLAITGHSRAIAYSVVPAHAGLQMAVVTAKSLSVSGPKQASGWRKGQVSVPVTVSVRNPNPFWYWAHTVTVQVAGTSDPQCDAANFVVDGSPLTVEGAVAANSTVKISGISVRLADNADPVCQTTKIALDYAVT